MNATACIEIMIAADEGGMFTDESRLNQAFLLGVLDMCRERYIQETYRTKRVIPSTWIQAYEAKADPLAQEDECWTYFPFPDIIYVNEWMDGLVYIGQSKGHTQFHRVNGNSGLALESGFDTDTGLMLCKLDTPNHRLGVKTGTSQMTRVYAEIIAKHPTQVPSFNIDKDDYPIDGAGMSWIEAFVRTGMVRQILIQKSNSVSDGENKGK